MKPKPSLTIVLIVIGLTLFMLAAGYFIGAALAALP